MEGAEGPALRAMNMPAPSFHVALWPACFVGSGWPACGQSLGWAVSNARGPPSTGCTSQLPVAFVCRTTTFLTYSGRRSQDLKDFTRRSLDRLAAAAGKPSWG